jgi:hypothetical protein
MAKEITITIDKDDLGAADPEFGIEDEDLKLFDSDGKTVRVKVFVDGAPTGSAKASARSITIGPISVSNAPTLNVAVTTRDERIISVLPYDTRARQFTKSAAETKNNETVLLDALEKAVTRIVAAVDRQAGAGPR